MLEQIESIMEGSSKGNLSQLSSEFYTLIPHSFGRNVQSPSMPYAPLLTFIAGAAGNQLARHAGQEEGDADSAWETDRFTACPHSLP